MAQQPNHNVAHSDYPNCIKDRAEMRQMILDHLNGHKAALTVMLIAVPIVTAVCTFGATVLALYVFNK